MVSRYKANQHFVKAFGVLLLHVRRFGDIFIEAIEFEAGELRGFDGIDLFPRDIGSAIDDRAIKAGEDFPGAIAHGYLDVGFGAVEVPVEGLLAIQWSLSGQPGEEVGSVEGAIVGGLDMGGGAKGG